MTPEQLLDLTDDELDTLRVNVLTEQERRHDLTAIPAELDRLNARLDRARGRGPA